MPDIKPSWRRIEAVLIELLREEGFQLEQVDGETSVTFITNPEDLECTSINIGDFAKELEQRL